MIPREPHGQLTELPDEFGKLQTLQRLWLDDNRLNTFPECILNLEGLEVLRLQNNKLPSIPPQIRVLRNLTELAADNNELTEVPDTLTELTCLTKLMLRQVPWFTTQTTKDTGSVDHRTGTATSHPISLVISHDD